MARPQIPRQALDVFLASLRGGATVREAYERAKIGKSTVYDYRADDPEFAAEWDRARDQGAAVLAEELFVRALDRDDPASASLLKFALSGYRRETFGQQVKVDATVQAIPAEDLRTLRDVGRENPELAVQIARALAAKSEAA